MRRSALLAYLLAVLGSLALVTDSHAQATPPSPVATGNLTGIVHKTTGKVMMLRTEDGGHVLRLENFHTSNGPDVRVYLVKGTNANNSDFIKAGGDNFVDLGALKGNIGNQNYPIPANVNLDEYKSVSIWCRRFATNFGAGSLEPTGQPAPGTSH
jgi:Electron transfer DM13